MESKANGTTLWNDWEAQFISLLLTGMWGAQNQSLLHCWETINTGLDSNVSNVYWTVHHCNSWGIKNQLDVTCYFYFTYYLLNMLRTLICPSSGACDCVDGLPHRLSCSLFVSFAANPNTQRKENKITDVVIHQHSRRLLETDILMFETCWANNKWNKNNKWHQVGF